MSEAPSPRSLPRWRLVLGRYASRHLELPGSAGAARVERALDFLYAREYRGRGVRAGGGDGGREGSLDPSQLTVPHWLGEVRDLFPKESIELIEKHALDRYGLTELVTDAETLSRLEPNMDLLKLLLTFRGQLKGRVLDEARRVVRTVVEELKRKLESEVKNALAGKIDRFRRGRLKVAQNLDARGTIRRNLKHWDAGRRRIGIETVFFFQRVSLRLPWTVVLCIDQSGSMASSVIHSAVMAGILAGLPLVNVKIVAFDTSVVDLSGHADDPVEILMSVQLGGGTDIGQAMTYCEKLVEDPRRTAIVLVSDFFEGPGPARLLRSCRRLRESGATLLGLAALDEEANAVFDRGMADRLASAGMEIAALTPRQLAEWLATRMR